MKIEVITTWYNEEFLAPFFLSHYDYADLITIFYDRDTTDKTLEIVKSDPRVRIHPFRFPDGMDDAIRQMRTNEAHAASECDWTIMVDADEFVFMDLDDPKADIRPLLAGTGQDVFFAEFCNVFRHRDDKDLDPGQPPLMQRRHGIRGGCKPCVARTGRGIALTIGCHDLARFSNQDLRSDTGALFVAHWNSADPQFTLPRRLRNRKNRHSARNRANHWGCHDFHITLKGLQEDLDGHLDDPRLF